MYFIFTVFSFFIALTNISLYSSEAQFSLSVNFEGFEELVVDNDVNFDENDYQQSLILSALIAKATPAAQNAASVFDYASRQVSSVLRKADPINGYVLNESNASLYQEFIDELSKEKVSFGIKEQHTAKKIMNRYWHSSQALLDAFKKQNLELAQRIMDNNNMLISTELNNQIVAALKGAKARGEQLLETVDASNNWLTPVADIMTTYDCLEEKNIDNFNQTLRKLTNCKWSALISPERMSEIEQASKLEYAIASQLVDRAKWLETYKNNITIPVSDTASQISIVHHQSMPPVIKSVALFDVKQEQEMLMKRQKNAQEALEILSRKQ
jgi:hypothetical protein